MKRNLRFWSRYTCESLQAVALVLVILLVIRIVGASRLELTSLAALAPAYLLLAAGMCIIMLNYGTQVVYIPMLLSLGETRRNIFMGYHYHRALIITLAVGISSLIWALVPGELSALGLRNIPSILAVLVTASALGSIIGTIYARWKWVATVLLVLVFGSFGGVGGFSVAGGGEDVAHLIEKGAQAMASFPWWLGVTALLALAADMAFQWFLLRRQEVKL